MSNKKMIKGVDEKLYDEFKKACVRHGLLIMPMAAQLFNRAMKAFVDGVENDADERYPEVKGVK